MITIDESEQLLFRSGVTIRLKKESVIGKYKIYSIRVKVFRINVNASGTEFFQEYKPKEEVPQFIKNIFGW